MRCYFDSNEELNAGVFDVYLNDEEPNPTKCIAVEDYTSLEALMGWTSSQLYLDAAADILDPTISIITGIDVLASTDDIDTLQVMFEVFENITTYYSPFYTLQDVPTPPPAVCPPPPTALTFIVELDVFDAVTFTDQGAMLVDNHATFFGDSTSYDAVGYSIYMTEDQTQAMAIESFQDIDAIFAWLSSPLYLDVIGSILDPTVSAITSVDVLAPQETWDALQPLLGQDMFVNITTYNSPFYSLDDTPNPPPPSSCGDDDDDGGDGMEGPTMAPTSSSSAAAVSLKVMAATATTTTTIIPALTLLMMI